MGDHAQLGPDRQRGLLGRVADRACEAAQETGFIRPQEDGTLEFNVSGGRVTVFFVTPKFIASKKLPAHYEGTVLQIVLQHERAERMTDDDRPIDTACLHQPGDRIRLAGRDRIFRAAAFGIAMTGTIDILKAIAEGRGPSQWIAALGYAGWGEGQLDEEMTRHGWFAARADKGILFDTPTDERWAAAFKAEGIDPRLLASGTASVTSGRAPASAPARRPRLQARLRPPA